MDEIKSLVFDIHEKIIAYKNASEININQLTDSVNTLIRRVSDLESQYKSLEAQIHFIQHYMLLNDNDFLVKAHENINASLNNVPNTIPSNNTNKNDDGFSDNFKDIKNVSFNDDDEFKVVSR